MADNPSQPQAVDPNTQTPEEQNADSTTAPTSGEQATSPEAAPAENTEQSAPVDAATTDTTTSDPSSTDAGPEKTEEGDATAEKAEGEGGTTAPTPPAEGSENKETLMSNDNKPDAKAELGAPPPPTADSKKTPAPGGKKKILKFIIPIIVVMILGGIGGGVSYYLGFWGKKPAETVNVAQAQNDSEATGSATVEAELITPDCVSGYKPFVNKLFSICYPITMDIKEHPATNSAVAVTEFTFEDAVETLKVLTNYKDNLNKFDCASSKVVKVATYSAHRYQVKDPNPKGGCAATINEYASLVSVGNDKPIFYIGLTRKEGSYQSDNGAYAAIEQSFRINQP